MNRELRFNLDKSKHVLLLPGMISPALTLFPLAHYLQHNQKEFGVTVIPLGMSIDAFDAVVEKAAQRITKNLLRKSQPNTVILFGHSHGGRVACEVVRRLKSAFPTVEYSVITSGSPIVTKPGPLSFRQMVLFNTSKAFRDWPSVQQPDKNITNDYFGYYSMDDHTVRPEFAKIGYTGELIEIKKASHSDLRSPSTVGPLLLEFLHQN